MRWTYQSTDLHYKVWGDQAVEDYYFYPDGFGTRVLTLKADPANDYELSEFIILTPQGAYPLRGAARTSSTDRLCRRTQGGLPLCPFGRQEPKTPRKALDATRDLPVSSQQGRVASGDLFQSAWNRNFPA